MSPGRLDTVSDLPLMVKSVRAASWSAAYEALASNGVRVALVGRVVRATETDLAGVTAILRRAGIEASLAIDDATFEEAFVELTLKAGEA